MLPVWISIVEILHNISQRQIRDLDDLDRDLSDKSDLCNYLVVCPQTVGVVIQGMEDDARRAAE